jgi:MFS transporter, FSR family, fosmidomycin resistance protein
VSCYLLSGSVGGLLGGPMADRFGPRTVIAWSLALTAPVLFWSSLVSGPAGYVVLSIGGFLLGSTLPVNVIYAHMIAPVATGTVSSLIMGAAWGVGGLAVPLVGMAGDAVGLAPALRTLALLPLAGAAITLALPRGRSHVEPTADPDVILPEYGGQVTGHGPERCGVEGRAGLPPSRGASADSP